MEIKFTTSEISDLEALKIKGGGSNDESNLSNFPCTYLFNCHSYCIQIQCGCNTPVHKTASCGKS